MTQISFSKYQGAGNDFIIIDDRSGRICPDVELFSNWCNRRFGIGADGVMLVRNHSELDFEMLYFNADGREGSMRSEEYTSELKSLLRTSYAVFCLKKKKLKI